MSELKTLKSIDIPIDSPIWDKLTPAEREAISIDTDKGFRQEAIKHVRYHRELYGGDDEKLLRFCNGWICKFFNLMEDDLK